MSEVAGVSSGVNVSSIAGTESKGKALSIDDVARNFKEQLNEGVIWKGQEIGPYDLDRTNPFLIIETAQKGVYEIQLRFSKGVQQNSFTNPDMAINSLGEVIVDYSRYRIIDRFENTYKYNKELLEKIGVQEDVDAAGTHQFKIKETGVKIDSFDVMRRVAVEDFLVNNVQPYRFQPPLTADQSDNIRRALNQKEMVPIRSGIVADQYVIVVAVPDKDQSEKLASYHLMNVSLGPQTTGFHSNPYPSYEQFLNAFQNPISVKGYVDPIDTKIK